MNLNFVTHPRLRGAGRALDLCPNTHQRLQRIRPYPNDWVALQRDNARIAQDFWVVIRREPTPDRP